MSFAGSPKAVMVWLIWFLLPFLPFFVDMFVSWFRTPVNPSMVMQETGLAFKAMAGFAVAWFLIGLAPNIMVRAESLGKLLLMGAFWCALAGWYWGPAVLASRMAPPAGTAGEPCTFEHAESFRQTVDIRAASGPAVGTRFSIGDQEWGDAITRNGRRTVPGKVYKGKRGLWYAALD